MKMTDLELAGFCRSLAALLHAGIGMADGIHLLAQEETGEKKEAFFQLGRAADTGEALWEALEHTGVFPAQLVAMARIGETTGALEQALDALADHYDQRHRAARQLRQAVAYPSMILILMLGVIGVLLVKVLPVFDSVYASLGSGLTGFSGALLDLGQGLSGLLPVLLGALLALGLLALCKPLRDRVLAVLRRRFSDRGILRKFNNAQFAQALSMGLGSGLSAEESVALAGLLLSDVPGARELCEACAEALRRGEGLRESLEAAQLLPAAQSRMLAVGIQGGNGDAIMGDIARRMLEEAEENLSDLVSRIEPAMVLTASLLVGAILLSVMLPLLDIMSTIG